MRKALLVFGSLMIGGLSWGCDICGCSINNYNPYLFRYISKNYLGMTYLHRVYYNNPGTEPIAKQYYNTILLTGQFSLTRKIQIAAMVPFQQNQMRNGSTNQTLSGLGDITLLANYNLWDKQSSNKRQTILIGGGIKLPTGKFVPAKSGDIDNQNFQLGTGSVDYLLDGSYRLGYRRWSFGTFVSYKYNTENNDHYRFGDVLTAAATAAYNIEIKNTTVAPHVQLITEIQMQDADNHVLQEQSGGYVTYAGGGLDVSKKNFAVGFNYEVAPCQNLSAGLIQVKPRAMAHVSFTF